MGQSPCHHRRGELSAGSASLPGHLHVPVCWDVCHTTCGAWLSQMSRCTTRSRAAAFQVRTAPTEQTGLRKKQHLIQCLLLALAQHCLELEPTKSFCYLSNVLVPPALPKRQDQ